MAADATDGMQAYFVADGLRILAADETCGFVGRIGTAPIAPTTFVFGCGTAIRTRNL